MRVTDKRVTDKRVSDKRVSDDVRPRPRAEPIPSEGADGLFTQTWFPVCLSSALPATGGIVGVDLLGGRVVAVRSSSGEVSVFSAYCVHLGADLSVGRLDGDAIRCAFHGWRYGMDGRCLSANGTPVDPRARLFRFPTVETHGIVWAFNGSAPLFTLPQPDPPMPQAPVATRTLAFDQELAVDPWVVAAQTMDLQHFALPHEGKFVEDPGDSVAWDEFSVGYRYHALMPGGEEYRVWASIHGSNIFWQQGTLDGRWFYWITGMAAPRPRTTASFFSWGTHVLPGETREAADFLTRVQAFMFNLLAEDAPVLMTIHYTPGLLTRSDAALAGFFSYLRRYPRANPARDFLR
ncbi:aromatic ring-hydroxylating oxygenase subunit alpha [Nonomuraea indica]|uniref:aromatic ring-hydroxylating oxygenase subunit alpha n=1 Tax=Nonomuraea indica TaxID=1581193 RepID=UPI000C7A776F|nr:Rieske 2Fe-2S domain-containing protein [Nonomuraea indica]